MSEKKLILFLFPFFFLTQSVSAEIKPTPDKALKKVKVFECSPKKLKKGDKLTLKISTPHGGDLSIIDPSDQYYSVSYWETDPKKLQPEINWEDFKKRPELILDTVKAKGQLSGHKDSLKPIFTKSGTYQILLGENLETENTAATMNTCFVVYSNKD